MSNSLAKYQYRVLALLILLFAITYLDRVCISIAGPRMQEELVDPCEHVPQNGIQLLDHRGIRDWQGETHSKSKGFMMMV